MDKILVIGPGSLVGSRFIELLDKNTEVYGAGGSMDSSLGLKNFWELDITSPENVEQVIRSYPGKYIINFAGATIVDEIEKNRPADPNDETELKQNMAYLVNVVGTQNIISACQKTGKFPIFISTGFVFDGNAGPYSEDDATASSPDQVSWYAWTKVLAEKAVETSGIKCLTIRISYPYRAQYPDKLDFARSFLKLYDDFKSGERESIYPIFADQKLTPTFVDDLAKAVEKLIDSASTGIFHVTSPEVTTPYDFCVELLRVARGVEHPETIITKGSIVEFQNTHPEIAKRPVKGGEKTDKISQLGFTPTTWKNGLQLAFGKK